MISEGKRSVDNLLDRSGMPKQFGTGRKRGKARNLVLPSHQLMIGREVRRPSMKKKRMRADAFGLY
jgi:hypothetical protein